MKVQYQFWRVIEVRQICHLDIDVPDDLASDRYLADSLASATLRTHETTMAWENETTPATLKSGHVKCIDLPPEER